MNTNVLIKFFDLEDLEKEEQEQFLDEISEVMMGSILKKAWQELDSAKKEALSELLEAEGTESNEDNSQAVLAYLDEHLVNLGEYVRKELTDMEESYKRTRDELDDVTS